METHEFRPIGILLVFRIMGVVVLSPFIGGVVTAICVSAEVGISALAAFALGSLLSGMLSALYTVLFFFSIRYELDHRYISKTCGVVWKQRRSVPLEKITNIDVRQGPFERMFGYGKIWIFTPSTGAVMPEQRLVGIPDPHDMKQTIMERAEATTPSQTPATQDDSGGLHRDEIVLLLTDIRDVLKQIAIHLSRE